MAPPKPGTVPLRPLLFGEIMDGSFQTIRRNAKAMLGAGLLAQSLIYILTALLTAGAAAGTLFNPGWADNATAADFAALGFGFVGGIAVAAVLSVLVATILQGAMVVPVARGILDRRTGFRQMWQLARSRTGALVRLALVYLGAGVVAVLIPVGVAALVISTMDATGLLILLPVMFGMFVLYIWLTIKVLVAPAAVVIEELGAMAAIRRSWGLTRANWWRILGITLVVGILISVISQVVTIPISLLVQFLGSTVSPDGGTGGSAGLAIVGLVLTAIVGIMIGALGYAFQTSVMALLYLDLRMRKDGLDISLLRLLESGDDPDGIPGRGLPAGAPGQAPAAGATPGTWPDVR
ncbi:hypothetical protein [Pseudarthrobacter sp. MEB009]|uniref:DUF7847 domain-containing protein n=1 Tax=Pseudarthrobacter sp. MEB009 TaxID=3040326 RepID=UPI0025558AA3|nr:hypothetical protein [Pseudarthrobacter sp. MEB009]